MKGTDAPPGSQPNPSSAAPAVDPSQPSDAADDGGYRYSLRSLVRPVVLCLAAVLAVSLIVRYMAIGYGLPYCYPWDEPEIMQPALRVIRNGTWGPIRSGRIGYGAANTALHAAWSGLAYLRGIPKGHFPAGIWGVQTELDTGYYWTNSSPYLWHQARLLSALLACLAAFLVFAAGNRLGGPVVGLGAAAVIGLGRLCLESTATITPDAPALACTCLCLWASSHLLTNRATWTYPTAAIAAAAAAGFKLNYVVALALPVVAHALSARPGKTRFCDAGLVRIFVWFVPVALVFQIDALLNPTLWLHNIGNEIRAHVIEGPASGVLSLWGFGYLSKMLVLLDAGTFGGAAAMGKETPFSFAPLGLPLVAITLLGFVYSVIRARKAGVLVIAGFAAAMAMVGPSRAFFFPRHMLIALPVASLAAGFGLSAVADGLHRFGEKRLSPAVNRWAATLLCSVILLPTFARACNWGWRQYSVEDSRVTLSREMLKKLPQDTPITILAETRWHVTPQEEKRFRINYATIPQLLHTPVEMANGQYIVAPARVAFRDQTPLRQNMATQMNQWLERAATQLMVGEPSVVTFLDRPNIRPGVRLIRNDASPTSDSLRVPENVIWGAAFGAGSMGGNAMSLANGPLGMTPGPTVSAPVRLTRACTNVVLKARGLSPTRQTVLPAVFMEAVPTSGQQVTKAQAEASFTLSRSQSGLSEYPARVNLPEGDYRIRLKSIDPDGFLVLVESVEFK